MALDIEDQSDDSQEVVVNKSSAVRPADEYSPDMLVVCDSHLPAIIPSFIFKFVFGLDQEMATKWLNKWFPWLI
jgi:hypothetical protein